MEKRVELNLLLDFYGALLTEHRREMLRLYVEEDMSLQEIADSCGISRQGVHDSINKSRAQLMEYEEKLGLMKRFRQIRGQVDACRRELETASAALDRAAALLEEIDSVEINSEEIDSEKSENTEIIGTGGEPHGV